MEYTWDSLGNCARLVNTSKVEPRAYQVNIIRSVFGGRNTLVVLPTGLGKTLIAVFTVANALYAGKKAILLAPTKPLSEQHYGSLKSLMNIEQSQILLLTGSMSSKKRSEMENGARVITATPQTIANDLKAGRLSLDDFGVVIFDECHRAVGRYAYTYIAEESKLKGVQVVGLTASPGSRRDRIDALIAALGIRNIEIRISTDEDVEKYVFGKLVTTVTVDKSPDINTVLANLKPVIEEHMQKLYSSGLSPFKDFERMPKGRLLEIGSNIKKIKASNYRFAAVFNYVYVLDLIHAYDLAATEGLYPFLSYMQGLRDKEQKSRVVESILKNKGVLDAESAASDALSQGREHPKMFQVVDFIKREHSGKSVIVFAQYRSTIKKLVEVLNGNGIRATGFVGKKDGVTDSQQRQTISDFRDRKFDVLVATSIAEEGLDIPSVDVAIFYEPVVSEIRNIQRRGRAGRIQFGDVVIFVTRGTKDETYNLISKMRERRMREIVERIQKQMPRGAYAESGINADGQRKLM